MIKGPRFSFSPLLLAALLLPALTACRQPETHTGDILNEGYLQNPRPLPKQTASHSPLVASGKDFFFLDRNALWWSWRGLNAPIRHDAREWRSLSASGDSVFAILTNGTLWVSGPNERGQLGLGHNRPQPELTQLGVAGNWLKVVPTSRGVLGLRQDGSLWTWGDGQLPRAVNASGRWMDIFAFEGSYFALSAAGALFAWGDNTNGQLGLGPQADENVVQLRLVGMPGQIVRWRMLVGTKSQTVALRQDGSLWSWSGKDSVPVRLGKDNDWKQIAAGENHVLALKQNGTLWAWGEGTSGQLGLGAGVTTAKEPQRVAGEVRWSGVAAGGNSSYANSVDGFFVWGDLNGVSTWQPSKVTPHANIAP